MQKQLRINQRITEASKREKKFDKVVVTQSNVTDRVDIGAEAPIIIDAK